MVTEIVGKFAHVVSDQYEKYGLTQGDLVFIAGSGFSPVDDEDNFKLLFVVSRVEDGVPVMDKGVTIARKSLEVLPDDQSNELLKNMEDTLAQRQEEKDNTG